MRPLIPAGPIARARRPARSAGSNCVREAGWTPWAARIAGQAATTARARLRPNMVRTIRTARGAGERDLGGAAGADCYAAVFASPGGCMLFAFTLAASSVLAPQDPAGADAPAKIPISVLYAGEAGTPREAAFLEFLRQRFVKVGNVPAAELLASRAEGWDVV